MADSYFTLADSNSTRTKNFAVLQTGYNPIVYKGSEVATCLDGGLDISVGAVHDKHDYLIRVRETEERNDYGDKEDLEYFYRLNNPNGTPSNILTLTDHFGNSHYVVMLGEFAPQYLGVMIEGGQAWMLVRIMFQFISDVEGS